MHAKLANRLLMMKGEHFAGDKRARRFQLVTKTAQDLKFSALDINLQDSDFVTVNLIQSLISLDNGDVVALLHPTRSPEPSDNTCGRVGEEVRLHFEQARSV
jgi:hypothetical protein